ncbi:hypothetical protein H671_6g16060 [Cricetulus griseus]|uniref:Uncharacterized protein n=1 Tax=Cricetulus griseus TaxID=10029 RepID=A0A061I3W7_CRIGR|nr:hypothetical protein H671_6g16060 [Cricetulus griseus]
MSSPADVKNNRGGLTEGAIDVNTEYSEPWSRSFPTTKVGVTEGAIDVNTEHSEPWSRSFPTTKLSSSSHPGVILSNTKYGG